MKTSDIFQIAKETILKHGAGEQLPPHLYVEFVDAEGKECDDLLYCANFGAPTPTAELQNIKQFKRWGNFRISLISQLPNDSNCADCQLPIRV